MSDKTPKEDKKDLAALEKKNELQTKLTDGLVGLFDVVINERKNHYQDPKHKKPSQGDVANIISSYANKNAAISALAGLAPGPWGMLAVVPEIIAVIRNQLMMIYDIGMAYGKEKFLTKELLMGIFLSGVGSSTISLLTIHGSKVLVKRASLKVFQKMVSLLAGKVTQQLIKATIAKWLPIVGAVAMASWSKYSTHQLGNKAISILAKDIEPSSEEVSEVSVETELENETHHDSSATQEVVAVAATSVPTSFNFELARMQTLVNLMFVDREAHPEEQKYILERVTACDQLTLEEKQKLADAINSAKSAKFEVDYSPFIGNPVELTALMLDMTILSESDNKRHPGEKIFIKHIGKQLGLNDVEINEFLGE